ncbi:hypothetical protein [Rhizobium sp. CNPSo 4039]|uniref:hypothetical protein n=1 Tax=Rhizobium sp. CNPSo 4039 TaxID=3021409 RepID=UPI00254EA7C2|nr:hypothetical protein [Rhizobium sp. CNPSo 4039]MDK4712883.1 hypothetical protein [Rhizobium sp. CNPSo 4039]
MFSSQETAAHLTAWKELPVGRIGVREYFDEKPSGRELSPSEYIRFAVKSADDQNPSSR